MTHLSQAECGFYETELRSSEMQRSGKGHFSITQQDVCN